MRWAMRNEKWRKVNKNKKNKAEGGAKKGKAA